MMLFIEVDSTKTPVTSLKEHVKNIYSTVAI